jgi:hypothetical protein
VNSPVSASDLADWLGLRRAGREWRGTSPLCGYRAWLDLSIGRTGAPLAWCAACHHRHGLRALCGACPIPEIQPVADDTSRRGREARSRERALAIWQGSVPVPGTPAEGYLCIRGLSHIIGSPALRYRAACPHPDGRRYPALVAIVLGVTGAPIGAHRTYIRRNSSAKADVEPQRASLDCVRSMLSRRLLHLGPVWGGAINLNPVAGDTIVVGEGLETGGAAGALLRLPAWPAISPCGDESGSTP